MSLQRSQQMSDHTVQALGAGWIRYLMGRRRVSVDRIRDVYFAETGNTPEGRPHDFLKWARQKAFVMDQLGRDPFEEVA